MVKNYNVSIEDNGKAFLIVVNKGTDDRFVVNACNSLGDAWRHIKFMFDIESQEFTVGDKNIPITEWVFGMKKAGYLE